MWEDINHRRAVVRLYALFTPKTQSMNDNLIVVLSIFATITVTGAIWSTVNGKVRRLEDTCNAFFQALKHQDAEIKALKKTVYGEPGPVIKQMPRNDKGNGL